MSASLTLICPTFFSPFTDIVCWMDDIARAHLPATVSIDEEGRIMTLDVRPRDAQAGWVRLSVTGSQGDTFM